MPLSLLKRKNMSFFKNSLLLLFDENVPRKVQELLVRDGFDVKMALTGSGDRELSKAAKSEGRIILTFDRHFGNILLFPPEESSGIIFIRINPPLIKTVYSALLNLFKEVKPSEFRGKLFVLSSFGFRVYPKQKL